MTAAREQSTEHSGTRPSLFARPLRAGTVGLLLVVTLIAFEAMAVATAMPRAVTSLHGLAYYGWPFTGFLVANVVGMVVGGALSDRMGPRRPVLTGIAVFIAGLLLAGTAPLMLVFVLGRVVQGLGSGIVAVAIYVVIAELYEPSLRPRMFALLSAAWVLPSLIGPVVAGALTEYATWRLVFLLIAPLALLGMLLIAPALSGLRGRTEATPQTKRGLWRFALVAAVGLAALQYAGQRPGWLAVALGPVGLLLLVPAIRRLVPPGTLRARRGLPAVVAARGFAAGAFFGVDALVPLTLTTIHGYRPTAAGIPLILGSLGWSAGSWWQSRHPATPRHRFVRAGFLLIAVASLGMAPIAFAATPGVLAYPVWLVGGAGMGLLMPSVAVLVLELSPVPERGFNSSAVQIADVGTSAITIGVGGVLVAAAERGALSMTSALVIVDVSLALLALLGALLAERIRTPGERVVTAPAAD